MVVLVTGGTGFIGGHLVNKLVAAGHKVWVPVRKVSKIEFLPSHGVKIREVDLLDFGRVKKLMKGIDVVLHLASIRGRGWSFKDEEVHRVNVDITENLLRASSPERVKHFIYVSSVSLYGHPNGGPIDEDYPIAPVTRYGRTKYESERLVGEFHRKKGLPTTIIRPVITYGPRDTWGMIPKMITLINSKRYLPVGGGENRVHLIYIDDLIKGLMLIITNQAVEGKTYILAGEEPININKLVKIISSALNRKVPHARIPIWFACITGYLMKISYRLFSIDKEPLVTLDKIDVMCRDRFFNIKRGKEELGFTPRIGYEEGIKKTMDWLKVAKLI